MDNAGSGSFAATEEYSKLLMSAWRKVFNNAGKGSVSVSGPSHFYH